MFEVFGVPFDRAGKQLGSAYAPTLLRGAGICDTLKQFGRFASDLGDVVELSPRQRLDDYNEAIESFKCVRATVEQIMGRNNIPLMLGGDHSLSLASVSGAIEAQKDGSLAVLWIDAHADINTPLSSGTQNLHGMPLAALMHRDPDATTAWSNILTEVVSKKPLLANQLAYIGLRDVEPGEQKAVQGLDGVFSSTMQDVDHWGLDRVLKAFQNWMNHHGHTHLWISFDVDCLDPVLAPGTGTMVRGGFTYREGHYLAEMLHSMLFAENSTIKLAGLDLVEVNPMIDVHNETARIAIEWLSSLLGKKVLSSASTVESFLEPMN